MKVQVLGCRIERGSLVPAGHLLECAKRGMYGNGVNLNPSKHLIDSDSSIKYPFSISLFLPSLQVSLRLSVDSFLQPRSPSVRGLLIEYSYLYSAFCFEGFFKVFPRYSQNSNYRITLVVILLGLYELLSKRLIADKLLCRIARGRRRTLRNTYDAAKSREAEVLCRNLRTPAAFPNLENPDTSCRCEHSCNSSTSISHWNTHRSLVFLLSEFVPPLYWRERGFYHNRGKYPWDLL